MRAATHDMEEIGNEDPTQSKRKTNFLYNQQAIDLFVYYVTVEVWGVVPSATAIASAKSVF